MKPSNQSPGFKNIRANTCGKSSVEKPFEPSWFKIGSENLKIVQHESLHLLKEGSIISGMISNIMLKTCRKKNCSRGFTKNTTIFYIHMFFLVLFQPPLGSLLESTPFS